MFTSAISLEMGTVNAKSKGSVNDIFGIYFLEHGKRLLIKQTNYRTRTQHTNHCTY